MNSSADAITGRNETKRKKKTSKHFFLSYLNSSKIQAHIHASTRWKKKNKPSASGIRNSIIYLCRCHLEMQNHLLLYFIINKPSSSSSFFCSAFIDDHFSLQLIFFYEMPFVCHSSKIKTKIHHFLLICIEKNESK